MYCSNWYSCTIILSETRVAHHHRILIWCRIHDKWLYCSMYHQLRKTSWYGIWSNRNSQCNMWWCEMVKENKSVGNVSAPNVVSKGAAWIWLPECDIVKEYARGSPIDFFECQNAAVRWCLHTCRVLVWRPPFVCPHFTLESHAAWLPHIPHFLTLAWVRLWSVLGCPPCKDLPLVHLSLRLHLNVKVPPNALILP